ncbi:hypothetical protein CEXT_792791 [Caerostris extrusa]|uniref:Uncharacterized protein n=1 Tax=Caerostris extrusa TaxID=172846 RepID=A0AAV4MID9_CAEEX|nr:hypothetical protein CEXT_792791 [Caerostris extrusa]
MTGIRRKDKFSWGDLEAKLPGGSRNALVSAEEIWGLFIEISRIAFSQIVNSRVRNGHHLLLLQLMATTRAKKRVVDASGSFNEDRLGGGIVKWNFMACPKELSLGLLGIDGRRGGSITLIGEWLYHTHRNLCLAVSINQMPYNDPHLNMAPLAAAAALIKIFAGVMTSIREKKSSVEISEAYFPGEVQKSISFGGGDLGAIHRNISE